MVAIALSYAAIVHAAAGDVDLVSRADGSSGVSGNGASTLPDASADGHLVAFLSRATNLTGDTVSGSFPQAFVRDLTAGTTKLASRADGTTVVAANAAVSDVSVSDDGRFVAFDTRATNLVAGVTTSGIDRAYVRDMVSGTTTLVEAAGADNAVRPEISADGHFVAFASNANYDGATGASLKVYVRDFQALSPTYDLASMDDGAAGATLVGDQPSLSSDGRFVAFRGQGGSIPGLQVLVRDRQLNTTAIASRASGATGPTAASAADEPSISADGRYVAFRTAADNLSTEDGDSTDDVFERDLTAATTTLISRADGATGAAGASGSGSPSVADDGRRVLFVSTADNLSPDDNDNGDNAYVRDSSAGTTTLVHGTVGQTPPPQGVISGVSLSGDGRYATYDTNATVLPLQETGSFADVFRRDLGAPPAPPSPPHLDVADAATIDEGASGNTPHVHFDVSLSAASAQPVTVDWATSDGTATAGSDYLADTGQIVIEPGQTSAGIDVTVLGDGAVEADETFAVTLSNPQQATIGRATGQATIRNDDAQTTGPPGPAGPRDHAIVGSIGYEPPFGVGVKGVDSLGPFSLKAPPRSITVTLEDAGGVAVAHTPALDPRGTAAGRGPVAYRLDDLPACTGCTLVLRDDAGGVHDRFLVGFPGDAGQSNFDLVYDRNGGAATGSVFGGKAGDLSVRIVAADGHVLADSAGKGGGCAQVKGSSAVCSRSASYGYRLTGLPLAAVPATAVLMQRSADGRNAFAVDSAPLTLDAGGETSVPDLNASSIVPDHARGRVLYGRIEYRAPFAPGAQKASDLVRPATTKSAPKITVALMSSGRSVASAPVHGSDYELDRLPTCQGCTVVLSEGKQSVAKAKVDVTGAAPNVHRLDLHAAKAGDTEFLDGAVVNDDKATDTFVVKVTDAATGALLADSSKRGTAAACGRNERCIRTGRLLYQLGGLPAGRDVIVTLFAGKRQARTAVDSRRITLAPEGEISEAPDLLAPVGGAPAGATRVLDGHVLLGGAFAPGGKSPAVPAGHPLSVRLVDAGGTPVASGPVTGGDKFQLTGVPACDGCMLELLSDGTVVQDRAAVDIRPDNGTTRQDLSFDEIPGGAYVQGALVLRRATSAEGLRVQLLDAAGHLLADSNRQAACGRAVHRPCTIAKRLDYRLGGVPLGSDHVTVLVLQGKKRLATARVTVAGGGIADTRAPDLSIAP
jgi:hypothetical protein